MTFRESYRQILTENRLEEFANDEYAARFETLTRLLCETNAHTNLTAITEPEEIIAKHYADSLTAASSLPKGAALLDVGCGGGFPTLPLAIVRPDLRITALDSTAKKLEFVKGAAKELGLSLQTLPARAEEVGKDPAMRGRFDAVTARAVANLPVLCEWCIPFVKVGGIFLAMKGKTWQAELHDAQNAIKTLGCTVEEAEEFTLCGASRCNILLRKVRPTPDAYPRKNGAILKKPL